MTAAANATTTIAATTTAATTITRRRSRSSPLFVLSSSHSLLLRMLLLISSSTMIVQHVASQNTIQYCGDLKECRIVIEALTCTKLAKEYDFFGSCCHLEDIPGTDGCRVRVHAKGNCAWISKCNPSQCDPIYGCNIEYQTDNTDECPNDRYEVLNPDSVAANDDDLVCPTSAPTVAEDNDKPRRPAPAPSSSSSRKKKEDDDDDKDDKSLKNHLLDNKRAYLIGLSIFVVVGLCCVCACLGAIFTALGSRRGGRRYTKKTTTTVNRQRREEDQYTASDEY